MKIIVGYKGTNIGRELINIAAKHAKAFGGNIFLVTSLVGGEKTETPEVINAEKNLEQAKKILNDMGVASETHLLIRGIEAGEDLVNFAREKNADEIIIGVRSRSKVGKFVFGSTSQIIILSAHCPVLSVK